MSRRDPTAAVQAETGRFGARGPGVVILVAGPDGAGKTTLSDALEDRARSCVPVLRLHHRPALLPARTRAEGPVTDPHLGRPYGVLASFAKVLYLYMDFALGWAARVRPFVRRGGLVVMERGWWDLAVDPRRYRLRKCPRLVHLLGVLLPRPDVVVILDAPVRALASRKQELPIRELDRQVRAWRAVLPRTQRRIELDAMLPPGELLERVAREIPPASAHTAASRHGWVALPGNRRFMVPRAPRSAALEGLRVYHPVTLRGRFVWELARIAARCGLFRLIPRGPTPPAALASALRPHIPPGGAVATAKLNHRGRYAALVMNHEEGPPLLAKVSLAGSADAELDREARTIAAFARFLPSPLGAPQVAAREEKLLLFEAAPWRPRLRPWRLPDEVALALGKFFRGNSSGQATAGVTHGDFSPWNLLRTGRGWVVLDWEGAQVAGPPYHDLFHYLVQSHALLGLPSRRQLLAGLLGRGWVGGAIRAYARGALLDLQRARRDLIAYLESSLRFLDPSTRDGRRGIRRRERLLRALGREPHGDRSRSASITAAGRFNRMAPLAGLGLLVTVAGVAVGAGGIWTAAALAGAGCVLLPAIRPRGRRARPVFWLVEIPVLLLLLSGLVLRIRGTEDIAENPLDPAGLFRVGCLGLGLFLGGIALLGPERTVSARIRSLPFRIYLWYVVVVFFGVAMSSVPALTLFRGIDLAAGPIVLLGALRAAGPGALPRIESFLYWFQVLLAISVWVGVVILPGEAVHAVDSPIPWQVEGALPGVASNGVGFLGVTLTVWSLGFLVSPEENRPRRWVTVSIAVFGLVTLIAAQYRTGYVALAVGIVVLLVLRRRRVMAGLAVTLAAVILLWGGLAVDEAEPVLLRGQSPEVAAELSSRVDWWEQAVPVWKKSPILGGGLLTATRFDVLAPIGRETTATIHSTWIEALVGTGVLGVALLGASFLVLWWRAIAEALRPAGRVIPLLLLAVMSVRSLTGSTFESAGRSSLLFLVLALVLKDRVPGRDREAVAARAGSD